MHRRKVSGVSKRFSRHGEAFGRPRNPLQVECWGERSVR